MEEKQRRAWRESRGFQSTHQNLWGKVFKDATEQVHRRELNSDIEAIEYQPRRIHCSESEIYYMDHEGEFWDEVGGNQPKSDEAIAARLDDIKRLHSHEVY